MIALFAGELRRVLARRLVKVLVALAVLGLAVAGVLTFLKTQSLTDAQLRARITDAQRQLPPDVSPCPPGENIPAPQKRGGSLVTSPPGCAFPVVVRDPRFHLVKLKGIAQGVTAPLVIVGWLIGASIIGADWQSRTITTILTWESRRFRVLAAKALASIGVVALFTFVVLASLTVVLLPSALFHGTTSGATGAWWGSMAGVVGRAMAICAVACLIGYSVASIGRNTAAALGAGFAYILVIENVLGNFIKGWRSWLLLGNAIVFVSGSSGHSAGVPGRSVTGAGLYLAAVALAFFAGAAVLFARRDVT
jgi:ABC-2 type transport system permease protein